MRVHFRFFSICTVAAFLISSCAPQLKVTQDYDKSANFTQYKTFAMDTFRVSSSMSQLNQNRIMTAISDEFKKKGLLAVSSNPDLLIHTTAIIKDKQSVSSNTTYTGGYGYGGYYRPYGWGGGMSTGYTTYSVDEYKDGSLIIEVVDAKSKNLLWEGIGNKEIDKPAKDLDAAVKDAVAKILAGYPPAPAKK
jgi:hypothetical protein